MNEITSRETYWELYQLLKEGKLQTISVVGLPRSNGTAIHIALAQAKKVGGQPMNHLIAIAYQRDGAIVLPRIEVD